MEHSFHFGNYFCSWCGRARETSEECDLNLITYNTRLHRDKRERAKLRKRLQSELNALAKGVYQ